MKITLDITDHVAELLGVLGPTGQPIDIQVEAVVCALVDHAQQGVYRPGAWERGWLMQAFGEEWTSRLEPGEPYYPGSPSHFMRPRRR